MNSRNVMLSLVEHENSFITGPQIRVHNKKLFFLFLNQNICCEYSMRPTTHFKTDHADE